MEKNQTQNRPPLTDWLVLVFVVTVMMLLIIDMGRNVQAIGRTQTERQMHL